MTFQPGQSGNPGGVPKNAAHIKQLARRYTPEAIETLAHWMRQRSNAFASIAAANALLDRGIGKPHTDPERGEEIRVTIRKILEIGAPTQPQKTNGQVIDHEPITKGGSDDGHEPTNGEC